MVTLQSIDVGTSGDSELVQVADNDKNETARFNTFDQIHQYTSSLVLSYPSGFQKVCSAKEILQMCSYWYCCLPEGAHGGRMIDSLRWMWRVVS